MITKEGLGYFVCSLVLMGGMYMIWHGLATGVIVPLAQAIGG